MKGDTLLLLQPMHFVIHDLLLFLEGKSKIMRKLKNNLHHGGLVRGFQPCGIVCDTEPSSDLRRSKSIGPDVQERHWTMRLQATYWKRGRKTSAADAGPQHSIPP